MKIARYWEKTTAPARLETGETVPVAGWGWSAGSREEAMQRARSSAERSAAWLEMRKPAAGEYGYHDRPAREEILRELFDARGETIAFVSRNSYGVEVLNTQSLAFIDIDVPAESSFARLRRRTLKLFGRALPERQDAIRGRIAQVAASHPQHAFRLYRTAAGFRFVLVSQVLDATSEESRRLLEIFGADILYQKLCHSQSCYRARLTPKPWRIQIGRAPHRFPFQDANKKQEQRAWENDYAALCEDFAVCRFVEQFGSAPVHAELAPLLELHDRRTKAASDLKLA